MHSLLNPRSVVLVGATDKSIWTRASYANLQMAGFEGAIHLVNRRGGSVLGRTAAASIPELGEPIDAALVMLPLEGIEEAIEDLAQAGARGVVLLSSGFAEAGAEGRSRQAALAVRVRALGMRMLGPNCLGFINFSARSALWAGPLRGPALGDGRVAIVSQSGATAGQVSFFAHSAGIALSAMVSTGNEADVDVSSVIDHLLDDEATRVIALFLETVRDPAALRRAAEKALRLRKPIVVLKVGRSELSAKAAQAHTGALVGDDRFFDAACERFGLVRVTSMEDLIFTADLLSRTGRLKPGGVGFLSMSGGVGEIAADQAEGEGLALFSPAPATQQALQEAIPGIAPHNPVDVTGAVMRDPVLFGRAVTALANDPAASLVLAACDVPKDANDDSRFVRTLVEQIAIGADGSPVPAFLISYSVREATDLTREILRSCRSPGYLPCGVQHGLRAAAAALTWSRRVDRPRETPASEEFHQGPRPATEQDLLGVLAEFDVPVIPSRIVQSAGDAVRTAQQLGGEVALKIASPDIPHKTEVGGVRVRVIGDAAVEGAYREILANVRSAVPTAEIRGVAVSPMRSNGVEIFVGVLRDPQWGWLITVGLGGIWVEALRDTSVRLLPVGTDEVEEMLGELRGARLLDGFRGAPATDRRALAAVIARIGRAALRLGAGLVSLEINPLYVRGATIEALDALALWE